MVAEILGEGVGDEAVKIEAVDVEGHAHSLRRKQAGVSRRHRHGHCEIAPVRFPAGHLSSSIANAGPARL